ELEPAEREEIRRTRIAVNSQVVEGIRAIATPVFQGDEVTAATPGVTPRRPAPSACAPRPTPSPPSWASCPTKGAPPDARLYVGRDSRRAGPSGHPPPRLREDRRDARPQPLRARHGPAPAQPRFRPDRDDHEGPRDLP